ELYAGSYPLLEERLQRGWEEVRSALDPVAGREMLHHSRQGNVSRTLYEGGTAVYVNEGGEAAAFRAPDGTLIRLEPYAWTSREEAAP
ncbi:MAG: DUF5696 domain-containing protein, partial [Aristaeellaceae bacterium]